jgi:YD repeat-containing protein
VEIAADRTAFSQTFANPDGTSTAVVSAAPRWVRRGSSWAAADATLVQGSDGSWSPAAALGGLRLSGGRDRVLATLRTGGYWLSLSWPAALPVPSVSGARATYRDVFQGVDLVVTAETSGGFDETLVVKNRAAAADPQLAHVALGVSMSSGLSQHAATDGSVVMAAGGTPVFSSPPPLAWDSASAGAGAAGPGHGAAAVRSGAVYGMGSVRLGIPARLLAGPASSFPVYIDPSYSVTSTMLARDMADSASPNSSFWSATEMGAGKIPTSGGIQRSYFRMSVPPAVDGATILSATFNGTVTNAAVATSTSHTVTLHSSGDISTATTWNNQPTWGTSPAPVSATFTTTSTTPNKAVTWNVQPFVQNAATANAANWTLVLTNSSETNTAVWVAFSATPTITITYDHAPTYPTSKSISPTNWSSDGRLYTSSATPTFVGTSTDADGDSIQYQVQILSGSTVVASGTTAFTPSGTQASWTDTTALTDLGSYTYQMRAYDGTEYSTWASGQITFTVQTDTPGKPTVTCAAYPAGTWTPPVTGGTTCSWNAPLSHMNGYSWSLDGGTNTWTTATSISINPGTGLHTLSVSPDSAGGIWGPAAEYNFGVGSAAIQSPADGSQTATTIALQAVAPSGYTSATFDYRQGTTGAFQAIPGSDVTSSGQNVTWPVSTNTATVGVKTPTLTWKVTHTLPDDGPVQIQAVFTDGNGNTATTPPVTVTLNRIGSGADFATTQAGPVTVGLQSGNASVSATDVSIASYGADLLFARTFDSLEPNQPSIFGWGWTSSLTGGVTTAWTQLTSSGSYVVLQAADGSNDSFTQGNTSNGITSWIPQGSAVTSGLTLTQNAAANTFTLTDSSGTVTVFWQANSAAGYVPQTVTVPGDSNSAGLLYDGNTADGTYGDPLLMVAPDAASAQPSTTACPYPASASTWTAGCRGLQFTYNSSFDVSQISFVYTDNSGAFHSVPVADYGYDSAGRLTSEWDPRLATPLVTGYTYDETPSDADYGRITQLSPPQPAGSGALAPWTLTYDDTSGDANYGTILTVSRTHAAAYGGGTDTITMGYSVPLTTSGGGPVNMDATTVGTWGQTDIPASAVAIFPPNRIPSSPPTTTDYQYAQIDYYDASGREVNTASFINGGWAVTTTQYDAYGNTTSTLSAANLATALASGSPAATAATLSTVNVYGCDNFGTTGPCTSTDQQYQVLTDTYGPARNASVDGTVELIRTHTAYTYDAGAPNSDTSPDGSPYMLVTTQTQSASIGSGIPGSGTADARTTSYAYANASTSIGWTLGTPLTTTVDPGGLNLVSTSVFNTSASQYGGANLQTGSYMPSDTSGGGAGDTETVYYTAGTNPVVAACGNKPEWANLTCQTGPAAQPGTSGLPNLPVTTYSYDDYLNVTGATQTFGTTGTRATTTTFDSAERPSTYTEIVTGTGMGTAVPETSIVYSASSGLPTDTQTLDANNNVTADINTTYDDFGNVLTYTDASGNTTSYTYDSAGRVASRNDGEGTETLTYSAAFPNPTQITDSQAGTFTATYNTDGSLVSETYPGNLTATYTYDASGTPTALSYNGQAWTAPLTDTVVRTQQATGRPRPSPIQPVHWSAPRHTAMTTLTDSPPSRTPWPASAAATHTTPTPTAPARPPTTSTATAPVRTPAPPPRTPTTPQTALPAPATPTTPKATSPPPPPPTPAAPRTSPPLTTPTTCSPARHRTAPPRPGRLTRHTAGSAATPKAGSPTPATTATQATALAGSQPAMAPGLAM